MSRLKHLMIIEDGQLQENSLHSSDRARAERLIALLLDGELGDDLAEKAPGIMRDADAEALQADYPEGVSTSLPRAEDYIAALKEWLATEGCDVFVEDLALPVQSTAREVIHA